MEKIFILLCLLLLNTGLGMAQNRSIRLEKPEWEKVIQTALKSKKIIFVDCHTSWCGPCKILARDVFTRDSVADYFNEYFVSVSYDVEKDNKPPFVGVPDVRSVPTLWFIAPQSRKILYGLTGAPNAAKLMMAGRIAQDTLWNFPGLKARFQQEEENPELFFAYYNALKQFNWASEYKTLGRKYMNGLKVEQFSEIRNWELFEDLANDPLESVFRQVCGIQDVLKEKIGKDRVERKINSNLVWGVQRIVGWGDSKDMPAESEYMAMANLIHSVEFQQKEWLVRLLDADKYARKGEWDGMLEQLKGISEHFDHAGNEVEWSGIHFIIKMLKSGTRLQLEKGIEYIDSITAGRDQSENIRLTELKDQLLKKIDKKKL